MEYVFWKFLQLCFQSQIQTLYALHIQNHHLPIDWNGKRNPARKHVFWFLIFDVLGKYIPKVRQFQSFALVHGNYCISYHEPKAIPPYPSHPPTELGELRWTKKLLSTFRFFIGRQHTGQRFGSFDGNSGFFNHNPWGAAGTEAVTNNRPSAAIWHKRWCRSLQLNWAIRHSYRAYVNIKWWKSNNASQDHATENNPRDPEVYHYSSLLFHVSKSGFGHPSFWFGKGSCCGWRIARWCGPHFRWISSLQHVPCQDLRTRVSCGDMWRFDIRNPSGHIVVSKPSLSEHYLRIIRRSNNFGRKLRHEKPMKHLFVQSVQISLFLCPPEMFGCINELFCLFRIP